MRNSSRLGVLGAALLAGASILPMAALAQSGGGSIETVVVTAEKRSEEAKNVPISLTAIGQDQLDNLNIRSFEDIQAQVPGLAVTEADPSHPSLIIRGINAGGDGSTVSTYLDDTPYGSSNALANGTDTAPNLDTFDMKQVLVLRGPQGTLYGAGAEGGLLKFVTNAPDTNGFDAAVELTGFDMDHGGFGQSERGMVNVAITDDLAVRVVGFDVRTPGYIKDPALGLNHVNDETSFGGRASILWTPTNKISVRFNVLQQQLDLGGTDEEDVSFANGHITPLVADYTQLRTTIEPTGVRYYLYNTTVNWDLDFATLTSSTSYTNLHDNNFEDATGIFGADITSFVHQGKFIQELRLASDPGQGPLDWLVGFYFANEHDALTQHVVPSLADAGNPADFIENVLLSSKYIEKTGFANVTYHVTSNFELGAGVRYANDAQSSTEIVNIPSIPLTETFGGLSQHNILTWSADARYHLDDNTMFYARVATGWRPGGPNDLPAVVPPGTPRSFNPDSLIDYELGVKSTLPDENVSFDADVYDIEWRDIQLLEVVNNFAINGNGGRANSKGAEANVTWLPIDRLTLNLNGAYTDAQLSENALIVGGLATNPLPFSPRWSGTLNGDYTFMPIGDFTPYAGMSWHYMGVRGWGFSASTPERNLPDYNTVDLRVGVDWNKWTLELYGKNLNGAKGISAFAPTGASIASGAAATASLIQPRVIGLVLRGKF